MNQLSLYIYIFFLLDLSSTPTFPHSIYIITGPWAELSLAISFTHSSAYTSVTVSQFSMAILAILYLPIQEHGISFHFFESSLENIIKGCVCITHNPPRLQIIQHAKQSKSLRERQIPYDITYMWNLKYNTNQHGSIMLLQMALFHSFWWLSNIPLCM